jgi:hypothetical protein
MKLIETQYEFRITPVGFEFGSPKTWWNTNFEIEIDLSNNEIPEHLIVKIYKSVYDSELEYNDRKTLSNIMDWQGLGFEKDLPPDFVPNEDILKAWKEFRDRTGR